MKIEEVLKLTPLRRQWFFFRRRRSKRRWLESLRRGGANFASEPEILGRVNDYERRISIGRQSELERDITFWLAQEPEANPVIEIGEKVYIGRNCYLGSYLPLRIGNGTIIGAYSYLITANHRIEDKTVPIRDQGYEAEEVTIGNNVWIGCHVVILPGVTIGDHSVVGAGAVVTKPIPKGEIWGGVPAKKIRDR